MILCRFTVDAKKRAREMRAEAPLAVAVVGYTVKIMFTGDRGEADGKARSADTAQVGK